MVFTEQDNIGVLFQASSIEMDAVDANGNVPQKCTDCDRFSFAAWPLGIAGFIVAVLLPNVNDVALFHAADNKGMAWLGRLRVGSEALCRWLGKCS